jgi:hypothetical protein
MILPGPSRPGRVGPTVMETLKKIIADSEILKCAIAVF